MKTLANTSRRRRSKKTRRVVSRGLVNTKSLSFDGTNDAARWASNSTILGLIGAGDFSISWWVKKADFFPVGSGATPILWNSLFFPGGGLTGFIMTAYGDSAAGSLPGKISLQIGGGVASSSDFLTLTSNNDLRSSVGDNTWHHCLITCDAGASSRTGKLYINGSEIAVTQTSNSVDFSGASLGDIAIGSSTFNLGSDSFFQIEVDELSIYNSELSSSDVSAIYNSGVPADESSRSGLVGYWRLEDNGNDSSSNSNNLTITGATFTDDVPS
jgi:hypothetical protein|tara:strand:+ start:1045 stop:1857 length:813 start_codon:yes stop_codon:yes gene_type:complete